MLIRYCLVLIFFPVVLFASDKALENTHFQHLSTQDGLSQKTVQVLFQDQAGFIWIGTQEGLNRYDGKRVKIYRQFNGQLANDSNNGQSSNLSNDNIRDLAQDESGRLFVATDKGLNIFNYANDTFSLVEFPAVGLDKGRINVVYPAGNQTVWVGTEQSGLIQLEDSSSGYQPKTHEALSSLSNLSIRALYIDSRNRLWIGTDGNGLYQWNGNELLSFQNSPVKSSLSHDRVRVVIEDSKGRIWIGTRGGGLNRFDELTQEFIRYTTENSELTHNRVYDIVEDDLGRLWVTTDGGISIYNENAEFIPVAHKSSQKYSLTHNRVLSALRDETDLLWFGTLSGVNIWNPKAADFTHYRRVSEDTATLSNNTIYSLAQLADETIVVGTFGDGINLLNPTTGQVISKGLPESNITRAMSLLVDEQNGLWVGGIANGLEYYDSNLEKQHHFVNSPNDSSSLAANGITDLLIDGDKTLWVATYRGGLHRYDRERKAFERFNMDNTDLKTNSIYALAEDDEGYIWLATDGMGLARFDKVSRNVTHITQQADNPDSLASNVILSIFFDSNGTLWLGTQGNGLNAWAASERRNMNNQFVRYTTEDGLDSSTVYSIVEDTTGRIWVSTVKGVSQLNKLNRSFTSFNLSDELHINELNQGASLRASDGRLYFGGLNGISAFYPQSIRVQSTPPRVILTNIFSQNEPIITEQAIFELDKIEFDYSDYLVAFEFAALDFSNPAKNQYQYQLEGLDDRWISLGNRSRATFTNLPSGEFTFKVRASNDDGFWSDESINLKVIVRPAPWASWWAYSLYALGFCIVLVWFVRLQARRLARNEVFQSQVEEAVADRVQLLDEHQENIQQAYYRLARAAWVSTDDLLPNDQLFLSQLEMFFAITKSKSNSENTRKNTLVMMLEINKESLVDVFNLLNNVAQRLNIYSIAKWDAERLVLLSRGNSDSTPENIVADLEQIIGNEIKLRKAFVAPFTTIGHSIDDANNLMILLEFVAHLLNRKTSIETLGIVDIHQALSGSDLQHLLKNPLAFEQHQGFRWYSK